MMFVRTSAPNRMMKEVYDRMCRHKWCRAQWPLVLSRSWLHADTIKEKGNVSLKVKTTKKSGATLCLLRCVCLRFCFLVGFVIISFIRFIFVDAATTSHTVTRFRSGFYWRVLLFSVEICSSALFSPLFFYSNQSQKATASKYSK